MKFSEVVLRTACVFSMAGFALFSPPVAAQNKIVFKTLSDMDACASKNSFDSGVCLEPLQNYAKANPKQLFAIGKQARLHFQHWVALQFFEPALSKSPSADQCADDDLALAVVSGLASPAGDAQQATAVNIFGGACHTALRPAIEKEIVGSNGGGYVSKHACPILASKGVKLGACEAKQALAAQSAQPKTLPAVDLATAKFGAIKVFAGTEGVRLTLADIPAAPGAFAIRLDGVRGDFNGKTLVHQQSPGGNGFDYWTLVDGKRWTTLAERGGSYKSHQAFVPGQPDAIPLGYSGRDSRAASEALLRK